MAAAEAVVSLLLQFAVIYVPFLQCAFDTVPLCAGDWLVALLVASSVLWLRELSNWRDAWRSGFSDQDRAFQRPNPQPLIPNSRAESALAPHWGCAPIRNDSAGADKRNPLGRLGTNHNRLDEWRGHPLGRGPFHDETGAHPTTGI